MKLLEVQNLCVEYKQQKSVTRVVDGLNFVVEKNSILGIAGESGSGKTVSALSILKLLDRNAKYASGKILWHENDQQVDLLALAEDQIRIYRGAKISFIFQEPMSALNPLLKCGFQASEGLLAHHFGSGIQIRQRVLECFHRVGLEDTERIYNSYPFQLSGGQLQRVLIAMAISCNPQLIIADEPTTALDVTLQKHIIDLLKQLKEELKLSILFISHDLGLIKDFCDQTVIMHRGRIVEAGDTMEVFKTPKEMYTSGLISCRPPLNHKVKRLNTLSDFYTADSSFNQDTDSMRISQSDIDKKLKALEAQQDFLTIKNLNVHYQNTHGFFQRTRKVHKAVNNVNFSIKKGETLGLVGESGSGKSTTGKAILNLIKADSGSIKYNNTELTELHKEDWRPFRKDLQIIFQDPYSSLNPKQTIGNALIEPMVVHKIQQNYNQRKTLAIQLLETVGLSADHFDRYPHQFSGGQRQRICIARALSVQPKFIICDEPVSALDVSIQAQILNLLQDLKDQYALSYLFISHDLSVVNFIADRIAVMKNGEIIEIGNCEDIILRPKSEYTKSLLASVPKED
jgi:peptide/nickel transport system ATP-binding protein